LGPNILLRTLFSNTLSLCSSLNVKDHISHPYKTGGRITVLMQHLISRIILLTQHTSYVPSHSLWSHY
jgi:hypothetical protein